MQFARASRGVSALVWSVGFAVACQSRTPVQHSPADGSREDGGTSVTDAGGGATPTTADDAGTGQVSESTDAMGGDGGVLADGGHGETSVVHEVTTWSAFSELATQQGELKFLLPVDESAQDTCWFQDTEQYPYHLHFLRTLPEYRNMSAEAYQDMVLLRDQRVFYAGALRLFSGTTHPATGQVGILTYTVYTASSGSELLTSEELIHIDRQIKACMGGLATYLVYLPEGNLALAAAEKVSAELEAASVAWIRPEQLVPSLQAEVYSAGEAYGYVRKVTPDQVGEVGPRDVVVADVAPGELGIVSALVTAHVQSSVSHLNLRLREKRIPNAAAPQLFASGFFDSLEGTLVHVQSSEQGLSVTPARLTDARTFWESRVPDLPDPTFTLETTELTPLTDLQHTDSVAFGTKAANLGELGRVLPTENVPHGVALPFAAYQRHVEHNKLQAALTQAAQRAAVSSPVAASEVLSDLRKQIRQAAVDPEWELQLIDAVKEQFGEAGLTTRLRFRSSTNVEDLPGLSGAGLYDSASGCLADDLDDDEIGPSLCLTETQRAHYTTELTRLRAKLDAQPELTELAALIIDVEEELSEEKSARKALRKVWASLWNNRAFQDREYYGIPHDRVFMGVAVHPSMVGEQLESVLVTNLEPDAAEPLYRIESQAGEVGVVEPQESDAVAERLQFRRDAVDSATAITLVTASSLSANGQSLWKGEQLEQMTTFAFRVHDYFAASVYPEITPLQLDVELDVSADGVIIVKQARPYVSGGW